MLLKKRSLPYEDFIADVKTGDVVLMRGTAFLSKITEFFEGCHWSHSGLLVWEQDIQGIFDQKTKSNRLLLWESNVYFKDKDPTPVLDVIKGIPKSGPQLVTLHDRIKHNYDTNDDSDFGIRHLNYNRTSEMYQKIIDTIREAHDAEFPDPPSKEFENFIEGRLKNKPATDGSFFCSQLLATTLMNAGLVTKAYPANAYAPADFSESVGISLLKRASLGKEIVLDPKTIA